jgi:hypothetical protein
VRERPHHGYCTYERTRYAGAGKPLFERRLPNGPMQLTGTRIFSSGMVELRYELRR